MFRFFFLRLLEYVLFAHFSNSLLRSHTYAVRFDMRHINILFDLQSKKGKKKIYDIVWNAEIESQRPKWMGMNGNVKIKNKIYKIVVTFQLCRHMNSSLISMECQFHSCSGFHCYRWNKEYLIVASCSLEKHVTNQFFS